MTENFYHLYTVSQMRARETHAVSHGLTLSTLMENAGRAASLEIMKRWDTKRTVILAGPGKNGGDGFVVARHLREAGWPVRVFGTPESSLAQEMAHQVDGILPLDKVDFEDQDLIIDALFGTGLKRSLENPWHILIAKANASGLPIVSLDLPSGVNSDTGEIMGKAIQATLTITFDAPKPGAFLFPGKEFFGILITKDIGIPNSNSEDLQIFLNTPELWKSFLKVPTWRDHKLSRGNVLVIGSSHMVGAPKMAALSARRVGAGYVTLMVPKTIEAFLQGSVWGEIIKSYKTSEDIEMALQSGRFQSVVIGPGMPPSLETQEIVKTILKWHKPTVLDGGALSSFENQKEDLFESLHENVVITPHEGEFLRLFPHLQGKLRIEMAKTASSQISATLILKGADTLIAKNGKIAIQPFASPWLATAGTGDILAGILGAFLSKKLLPFEASLAAVWVHASASQIVGPYLIAEDLIEALPQEMKCIFT
ncbi:Bifunctional NAD(P)H-hydrate repair enzyme Nnr [Candidatus Bealeia paramacronuclearis]|uniref:Bifunctional NAD(P)H-hydrate repair enzyme n=2 Tax=Candidatus Bealeia paramacronuclearis TaxID=1921001 RepID=A0ABZ2C0T7_9PROT|nr:Bifunctional NAD(P)H-hydrate repair enzyme Nnr [Candidatus Bealeia paramacronuclearis]